MQLEIKKTETIMIRAIYRDVLFFFKVQFYESPYHMDSGPSLHHFIKQVGFDVNIMFKLDGTYYTVMSILKVLYNLDSRDDA